MTGRMILIVDDDKAQHEILDEHLNLAGYNRLHANDGAEALKMVQQKKPDLILLDIQMPVMDGFKTLATLRGKMGLKNIPVMLLSSMTRQHLKVKGLELGADDYITKPFNSAELIARIRAVFRRNDQCEPKPDQISSQKSGRMSGNLADISLSELLQSMELGNKTAHVHLEKINGDIFIHEGQLIHAKFGNFTGNEALQRIFLLEGGGFVVVFDRLPENIPHRPQAITSVLMAMLAYVDEVNEIIDPYNGAKTQFTADGPVSAYPAIEVFRARFPMSMRQLMILMDGSLKQNFKSIVSALDEKQLIVLS